MPKYYDKQGNSSGTFLIGMSNGKMPWNFDNEKEPDVIVLNLGTNDASYCKDAEKKSEFVKAYVEFIKQLRGHRPNAQIICCLGIMGADLYPQVEEAVKQYHEATGDKRVTSMKFDNQNPADGYAVDYHPTEATHEKAAKKLAEYIQNLY